MNTKIEYSEMTPTQREQLRAVVGESQNIGEGFNRESAQGSEQGLERNGAA